MFENTNAASEAKGGAQVGGKPAEDDPVAALFAIRDEQLRGDPAAAERIYLEHQADVDELELDLVHRYELQHASIRLGWRLMAARLRPHDRLAQAQAIARVDQLLGALPPDMLLPAIPPAQRSIEDFPEPQLQPEFVIEQWGVMGLKVIDTVHEVLDLHERRVQKDHGISPDERARRLERVKKARRMEHLRPHSDRDSTMVVRDYLRPILDAQADYLRRDGRLSDDDCRRRLDWIAMMRALFDALVRHASGDGVAVPVTGPPELQAEDGEHASTGAAAGEAANGTTSLPQVLADTLSRQVTPEHVNAAVRALGKSSIRKGILIHLLDGPKSVSELALDVKSSVAGHASTYDMVSRERTLLELELGLVVVAADGRWLLTALGDHVADRLVKSDR